MRTFASVIAKRIQNDSLAQLVEQLTLNQWVEGSNPSGVTKDDKSRPFFVLIPADKDIACMASLPSLQPCYD